MQRKQLRSEKQGISSECNTPLLCLTNATNCLIFVKTNDYTVTNKKRVQHGSVIQAKGAEGTVRLQPSATQLSLHLTSLPLKRIIRQSV